MSKHTPGPWHRNIPPARKYCVVFSGRNTHVAAVKSDGLTDSEIEANCNLIAAAPDLLEALDYALSALAHCRADKGYGSMQSRAANLAANAIAKARGEK